MSSALIFNDGENRVTLLAGKRDFASLLLAPSMRNTIRVGMIWSSHLYGAKSELIVHSGHGAQYDPEAIREVERILKENLTDKN
jgi:hypothetical protein